MKRYGLGQTLWILLNGWILGFASANLWHDRHVLTWGMFWPALTAAVVITGISTLMVWLWRRPDARHSA